MADRQGALTSIWQRLFIVLIASMAVGVPVAYFAGNMRVPIIIFLVGTVGGYVSIHRSLGNLTDAEVIGLSTSWFGIVLPSFVGGVLGLLLYAVFLGRLLGGDVFPSFDFEPGRTGLDALFDQHAKTGVDYAKLFFWSFVAGFNQGYVVDIINSVKRRADG
jgi:hypothetical protein